MFLAGGVAGTAPAGTPIPAWAQGLAVGGADSPRFALPDGGRVVVSRPGRESETVALYRSDGALFAQAVRRDGKLERLEFRLPDSILTVSYG